MFGVTITSPWGEPWEWLNVSTEQAQAIYEMLGQPDHVAIRQEPRDHGGLQ